jgi:hypothetical protein
MNTVALPGIDFGQAEAEHDQIALERSFYEAESWKRIAAHVGIPFIIGRKGAGKSAIATRFEILEPPFRYLFSDLKGRAQFIVVNPENKRFENHINPLHPRSPRGKTFGMLKKFVSEDLRFVQSAPGVITTKQLEEFETIVGDNKPAITACDSFADFTYWELGG